MKMWCFPWSESIKKRACRYLLQRYLGNFLEQKLTLDQLSVNLYNGTGTVSDVTLDCEALNELGDSQNWPLEIVDGHMKEITVTIPWSTLLKEDSVVEVRGLSLTVQPKVRAEPASSMLESMWSSMSSSMQLAADCMREEDTAPDSNPVEGIEMFAHAIDSILSRVKVKFVDARIRIEHVPKNGDRGIAMDIRIDHIDYFDEAGAEPKPKETDPEKPKTYIETAQANKKIKFEGVTLYTDEFPSKFRTMARSLIMDKSMSSQPDKSEGSQIDTSELNYQSTLSDETFFETKSVISTIESDAIREVVVETKVNSEIREVTPEERANQPDPILFAKLTGVQEIEIGMRRPEDVEGAKVEVRMVMGSLIVFITPRQLQTLIELVDAINQPDLEDRSNIPLRTGAPHDNCKPMRPADFQIVEAQMLANMERQSLRPSGGFSGWSGPSLEESDTDSMYFHPMTSRGEMAESFSSTVSSMNTSMTSSMNTSQSRIRRNKKAARSEADPTGEVSHISLRFTTVSCVLLHKDILATTPMGFDCISPASAIKLHEMSKDFFDNLQPVIVDDFFVVNQMFDRALKCNHIRLLTTEVTLDGSDKTTPQYNQTICEASVRRLLLRECLHTPPLEDGRPQVFDLIRFEHNDDDVETKSVKSEKSSTSSKTSKIPDVKFTYKQSAKYRRICGEKKLDLPTTDIVVKCSPCVLDIDLTLMERVSCTLFGNSGTPPAPTTASPPQNQLNFSVQCRDVSAILRFPIADLRYGINHEMRRVRPDYLSFKLQNLNAGTQQLPSTRPLPSTFTLKATAIDLYYHENDSIPPTHIARTVMLDPSECNVLTGNSYAPIPTISLTFQPKRPSKSVFDEETPFDSPSANQMTTSMYVMNNLSSSQPSPFSGKKMAHQSITKHEGDEDPKGREEEFIVPGTEEEMAEFTNSAIENSAIHLELNLPVLSLQLESKQLYEILYNRINSDLLLWEPQMLDPYEISPLMCASIYPSFGEFKGGYDSETDTSTSSEEQQQLYYSTFGKLKGGNKVVYEKTDTHNFCFTLKVAKGLLSIYAPVRDSNKRVVPGQMGEMVLEAQKLSMCQLSGLLGLPKSAQMCLRSHSMALYHEPILTIPSEKPDLRQHGSVLPSHLKTTIYPSGKGVLIKPNVRRKDMFTLALKIDPDPENSSLKSLCIAIGIEQATLRHRGEKGIAWLTQLMDVLDVLDYPVPGYCPSNVVSELHVHVWDCAIDYRPIYMPIRVLLTLGHFKMSNNVIEATNTSCLRFLAQDSSLYLRHVAGAKPGRPVPLDDEKMPDLSKDYVCVVDIGLFELSLRMDDKNNPTGEQPLVDLSASNNMVTINTCWDSAASLCRLLAYCASDGDSLPPYEASSRHTSICSEHTEALIGIDERPADEMRELSPSELQQVNELMEEAMKESPNTTLEEEDLNSSSEKEGVEVFFFPDESNTRQRTISDILAEATMDNKSLEYDEFSASAPSEFETPKCAQVASELGDPSTSKDVAKKPRRKKTSSGSDGDTIDDEYYIVESHFAEEDNDLDEPVVNWLGQGPTHMCDDHFKVPGQRADVLKAPSSFPAPVYRYTLCEMSVTWNMYGGSDFRPAEAPKKTVTIDPDVKQSSPTAVKRNPDGVKFDSVSYSARSERAKAQQKPAAKSPPRARGGPHRDHHTCVKLCLSKVRFQYEIYPAGGLHASRQTLAISKIEVLDRLKRSDINKLLSQYKLKDEPERTNAHMLIVKAVHLRPDPTLTSQECCLKVSLLPLWFNLDQDTLAFLIGYFSKLSSDENLDDDTKSISNLSSDSSGSRQTTPTHRPPVMGIASHLRDPPPTPTSIGDADSLSLNETVIRNDEPLMETYEAERLVSENLIQLEEDFQRLGMSQEKPVAKLPVEEPADDSPIYFRRIVFAPEVPVRLDYVGKRVDLSAGPVAGLLMGLGQLNCSELTLKRLDHRLGLLGLEKLVQWALQEWLSDIKANQLPGLLSGIGPMHSLLQLLTGIRDLLWLPVEQWRRDGRLVHGLRRGAASFTARTAVAALDITTRLLQLIQATAETAFDMLTPSPTLQLQSGNDRHERRRRRRHSSARHPSDIREGVATAYRTVREGFAETAASMALAARHERGVGVLRHLPGAAVTPLALAAAGAADVLGGVRAHLAPAARRDHADKWRQRDVDNTDSSAD